MRVTVRADDNPIRPDLGHRYWVRIRVGARVVLGMVIRVVVLLGLGSGPCTVLWCTVLYFQAG